jgi:transketolase
MGLLEKDLTVKKATREAFGDEILELGKKNKDIYVVDIDIGKSCKTTKFSNELPKQHINVGIAEQNAAGMAAGLATTGKIPFISTYAVFGSLRMAEQIRQEVCYPNLNVKIACSHGGLTPANDGGSHQAIEDMGVYRTIPNMTVIMGSDYYSTRKLIAQAAELYGPVYLRFTRDAVPIIYDENEEFTIGKAKQIKDGNDVAIIANGDTVSIAIEATKELEKVGISVKLLDMHTIKPIDRDAVVECVNVGKIITVEDHNILNGLGSAVCEIVAEEGRGKVRRVGVQDQFGQSAPYEKLLELNGITVKEIVKLAKELVGGVEENV